MVPTYRLALISTGIVAVCMALLKEPLVIRERNRFGIKRMIHSSLALIKNDKVLAAAVLGGITINSTIVYLDEFITLHLRDNGLPVQVFGVVMAGAYLSRGAGNLAAGKLAAPARNSKFYIIVICLFFYFAVHFRICLCLDQPCGDCTSVFLVGRFGYPDSFGDPFGRGK